MAEDDDDYEDELRRLTTTTTNRRHQDGNYTMEDLMRAAAELKRQDQEQAARAPPRRKEVATAAAGPMIRERPVPSIAMSSRHADYSLGRPPRPPSRTAASYETSRAGKSVSRPSSPTYGHSSSTTRAYNPTRSESSLGFYSDSRPSNYSSYSSVGRHTRMTPRLESSTYADTSYSSGTGSMLRRLFRK